MYSEDITSITNGSVGCH